MTRSYEICNRCIMDTSDAEIVFDNRGICNHCREVEKVVRSVDVTSAVKEKKFHELLSEIKIKGKKLSYDCVIGLSGGVDSSYVAYKVKQFGLRPLAVHLDNGWNSELAVKNIENIVKKLDIDLCTCVLNWEEFKQIQLAYLRSSVIDAEVPTDHAITAVLYRIARREGVSFILTGNNIATEQIMPSSWLYGNKLDVCNFRNIVSEFGSVKLKTYPTLGFFEKMYYEKVCGVRSIDLLDLMNYCKDDAKLCLRAELGWTDYGGKHHESIFTKFYQSYILPKKFNVDKRRAHLSSLVVSGQITREEALCGIQEPLYSQDALVIEKNYVLKKLGLNQMQFEEIMHLPVSKHGEFSTDTEALKYYYQFCTKIKKGKNFAKKIIEQFS